jgi:uncharacterized membrane protein YgaE (UPF0421/DUF939 family)
MKFGFGARVLKTGLAVSVAMYVAMLFDFTSAVFAGIAAIFSIQPSIYRSYQYIFEQLEANIIGAISAVIMVYFFGNDPVIVGFTMIIVLSVCLAFKIKHDILTVALVAVIAIMETTEMPILQFAGVRVASIMIGILSAFIVNLVFLPPKHETRLFKQIEQVTSEIIQWIRITSRHLSNQPTLKEEIKSLVKEITKLDHTYLLYSEEKTYSKRSGYERARKLVLFRQLIYADKKALDLLRALNRYDNEIEHAPEHLRTHLVEELDKVIAFHEQLLLICKGKISREKGLEIEEYAQIKIMNLLVELVNNKEFGLTKEEHMKFLPLAAKLMDYNDQLEHLNRLLTSYQIYHKKEKINIDKE